VKTVKLFHDMYNRTPDRAIPLDFWAQSLLQNSKNNPLIGGV